MSAIKGNAKQFKRPRPNRQWSTRYLFLKIGIVLVALAAIYGIYLDQKIKERIDGTVWQLPVAVYGQIVNLEPEESYSLKDIVSILNGAQYRQVQTATRPGEFVVDKNTVEIYRRPFYFPDGQEGAFRAKISFINNRIQRINNMENGRDFGFFRIDPKLITMMSSPNGEQRLVLPLKSFPDSLIKTLIETEDRRFYDHDGISFSAIGRALIANFSSGKTIQGGSTLTQQLVKNLFLSNERSIIRKLREAYMAVILETRCSKERILELYLNEVYLGQSNDGEIHGFPLASLYYFGRPVDELTIDQQALLVGIVKGASFYNPWTRPERATARRNVVLKVLEEREIIDNELYELLSNRSLGVLPKGGVISPQPAFMQLVRQELRDKFGDKIDRMSGMKVFTTFDPIAQEAAEQAVIKQVNVLRKAKNKPGLEAAMVITSRLTGEIKAVIGSASPNYPGFNRAFLGRRQIGSLAKPPTYLTALSQPDKYQLNTILDDNPLKIQIASNAVWEPKNYNNRFRGDMLLVDALAYSQNVPSIRLGMALGFKSTETTLIALGVPPNVIEPVPSRYVGALELTPLEVAQLFQVIGNEGNRSDLSVLRYVMDDKGGMVYQSYPRTYLAVEPQAAYLTLYAMQQAVNYGSGRSLSALYGINYLAGKTGTTNDYKDSWFAGIDGKDVTIVWLGLDDHQSIDLTGSRGALAVYRQYLAHNPPKRLIPIVPPDIVMAKVDSKGRLMCSGSANQTDLRTLPFWTKDLNVLCNETNAKSSANVAPNWLKQLFNS